MQVIKIIQSFIENPEQYWESNKRQITKFITRRDSLLKHNNWDVEDFVVNAQAVAIERIDNNIPSIYLPSFGSSGSHLLQQILNLSFEIMPLGEVYVPPKLTRIIRELSITEKNLFIELYNIIHCQDPNRFFKLIPIVNTAHTPILTPFGEFSKEYRSLLILRNPINIVLSRTFRKNEYKEYLGLQDLQEEQYLLENIIKTTKFYKQAYEYNYQTSIRYESVVSSKLMIEVARTLEKFMVNIPIKNSLISSIESAVFGGDNTNKFIGDKVEVPEKYKKIATRELEAVAELFGY